MSVQIVHHQRDGFGRLKLLCNVADKVCEVTLGAPLGHLGHARSGQGFGRHGPIAGVHAPVLVIQFARLTWAHRQRWPRLANQLARGLVHAYHRAFSLVRAPVNIQNLLHRSHELVGIAFRRNHPFEASPGLDFVFFRTLRTVS